MIRAFGFLVGICLIVWSCKNEPYEQKPLGVTAVNLHGADATSTTATTAYTPLTYTYRDERLSTFIRMSSTTDTVTHMKFQYSNGTVSSIIADSSKTSYKFTSFYPSGDGTMVTDTTKLIDATGTHLVTARAVTYGSDGNPVSVDLKTWTDAGITEELAELTWDDDNVTRLVNSNLTTGQAVVSRDLSLDHDNQFCVYMKEPAYLYTFLMTELYWLSKNNPSIFNTGGNDRKYMFWYNKFGYPSNFQSDTGAIYGVAYTQIR
jgi:hypothetical protein